MSERFLLVLGQFSFGFTLLQGSVLFNVVSEVSLMVSLSSLLGGTFSEFLFSLVPLAVLSRYRVVCQFPHSVTNFSLFTLRVYSEFL